MSVGVLWHPGIMSSVRQDWATPWRLFEMLDREFGFVFDACADASNHKCITWARDFTGLDRPWANPTWCNPPYGRAVGDWIEKGYRESRFGVTVVMLLPARTDTSWWHDYCMKGEIRFLRGRLNFDDTRRARAPFPSVLVIFRPPQSANVEQYQPMKAIEKSANT